jgi:asparagine synthase (glutamine-hydrolysing)
VKVALTGDGGDEAFAGYERYVAAKIASYYEKIPYLIREPILKILNLFPESASAKNILRRAKRVASAIQYPSKRRYARWITHFHNEQKETLYSPEMADEVRKIDSLRLTEELFDSAGTDDFLDASLFVDTMSSLSDGLMMKIDIASMANSLEVRSPFLDHKLFEFACSLPSEYKLKGMKTKYILKRTLSGILPKRIAKRGKMGFTVPFGVWFRGRMKDYADHILLSNRTTQRGYFRKDSIKDLLDEHTSGKINHSHRIFSLIMLELWHRVFMD